MINRKYLSIKNNKDIEKLMEKYNYFHDSCINEISYESGAYVNEDLSMNSINDKRILKVVFQRQENPRNLEIKFNKLVKLNYICLFDYLFISSQMSAKPYFIGSTGILLLW
ncbi:hypothetical protein [Clostridium sp.]|jgi:hypothetical protein|uniref:hypothetical protein n=1 Tax=Clostridium sp. TaxID=1506 RepID=UPI0029015367|nr:hypothetical protein [Clostridium sp.]MDU1825418.1 hypothetical protein [Clostridium sp.]MDU1842914.1 hypothetical protein [Clostridium sp.]MDU2689172.1 hypothetical protein [Clostridium sp.]MDU2958387.1 hypothetical protein [Clostridium sp.]MDU3108745.1 hypothetical protein [Clostridium sp.]